MIQKVEVFTDSTGDKKVLIHCDDGEVISVVEVDNDRVEIGVSRVTLNNEHVTVIHDSRFMDHEVAELDRDKNIR